MKYLNELLQSFPTNQKRKTMKKLILFLILTQPLNSQPKKLFISWDSVSAPDLAGYYIYISDDNGLLTVLETTETSIIYPDPPPSGSITVTAFDESGNESQPSESVMFRSTSQNAQDSTIVVRTTQYIRLRLIFESDTSPSTTDTDFRIQWIQFSDTYPGRWTDLVQRPDSLTTDYWISSDTLVLNTPRLSEFNPGLGLRWKFRVSFRDGEFVETTQDFQPIKPLKLIKVEYINE